MTISSEQSKKTQLKCSEKGTLSIANFAQNKQLKAPPLNNPF